MTVILVLVAIVVFYYAAKNTDKSKRSKGRSNLNRKLGEYGFGSFEAGVKADVESAGYGCLGKALAFIAILIIMYAVQRCSSN